MPHSVRVIILATIVAVTYIIKAKCCKETTFLYSIFLLIVFFF